MALGRLVAAPEEKFSESMSPGDFAAAGLSRLSPEELGRLNSLVEAYKSGSLAAARRAAEEAQLARRLAEEKAVRSEAEAQAARQATAQAEAAKASKADKGFLAKAKVRLLPGTRVEYAMIESTIPGKFRGWEGRAIFLLANGQRWQEANGGSYYVRAIENPKVQITPAVLGGYWMYFPDLDTQVRVKLVGE